MLCPGRKTSVQIPNKWSASIFPSAEAGTVSEKPRHGVFLQVPKAQKLVIIALRKQRQEDWVFKVILSYLESLRPAWDT